MLKTKNGQRWRQLLCRCIVLNSFDLNWFDSAAFGSISQIKGQIQTRGYCVASPCLFLPFFAFYAT